MNEVGRRFKANEFYVPEVLLAARAMSGAMSILKPLLIASKVQATWRCRSGHSQGRSA